MSMGVVVDKAKYYYHNISDDISMPSDIRNHIVIRYHFLESNSLVDNIQQY